MNLRLPQFLGLFALTALTAARTATAQPAPLPRVLMSDWLISQRGVARFIERIGFREDMVRRIDGPEGIRVFETASVFAGNLEQDLWERVTIAMSIDGEEIQPDRRKKIEEQGKVIFGEDFESLLDAPSLPLPFLASLRPVRGTAHDEIQRVPVWRVQARPPREYQGNVQHVTLWFSQGDGRLVRTLLVMHHPDRNTHFSALTYYQRINGLDLPMRRRVDGSARIQRRSQTFTLQVNLNSRFSGFRFDPAG